MSGGFFTPRFDPAGLKNLRKRLTNSRNSVRNVARWIQFISLIYQTYKKTFFSAVSQLFWEENCKLKGKFKILELIRKCPNSFKCLKAPNKLVIIRFKAVFLQTWQHSSPFRTRWNRDLTFIQRNFHSESGFWENRACAASTCQDAGSRVWTETVGQLFGHAAKMAPQNSSGSTERLL